MRKIFKSFSASTGFVNTSKGCFMSLFRETLEVVEKNLSYMRF
jgi:hypothetical protein